MDVLQRLVGIEAHAEVPAVALQYLGVDVRVYLFGLGVPEQLLRVDLGAADDGRVALLAVELVYDDVALGLPEFLVLVVYCIVGAQRGVGQRQRIRCKGLDVDPAAKLAVGVGRHAVALDQRRCELVGDAPVLGHYDSAVFARLGHKGLGVVLCVGHLVPARE